MSFALDVSNNDPITRGLAAYAQKNLGVTVLIAKATEGAKFEDATLATHRAIAQELGLRFGTYLFLHSFTVGNEAKEFLAYAKPRANEFIVVDSEAGGEDGGTAAELAKRTLGCCQELEKSGYRPILYSSTSTLEQFFAAEPLLKRYRIWQAQYPGRFTRWFPWLAKLRTKLGGGASVVLWQWTDVFAVGTRSYDASRLFVSASDL